MHTDDKLRERLYLENMLKKPCRSLACIRHIWRETPDCIQSKGRYSCESIGTLVSDYIAQQMLSTLFIEYVDLSRINSVDYSEQMFENRLENAELEFMEQIYNQNRVQFEPEGR